jgi:hypothetical protein
MGVDIKLFVEIDYSNCTPSFNNEGDVRSLAGGEFFVRCDCSLFRALAGLIDVARHTKSASSVIPRGLPLNVSDVVYYRYYHIVDERGYEDAAFDLVTSSIWTLPVVSESVANEWVNAGLSHYAPQTFHGLGRRRRPRVSDPDWKYVNWLTPEEFRFVVQGLRADQLVENPEISGICSLLGEIQGRLGPDRVRVVYWFDGELADTGTAVQ